MAISRSGISNATGSTHRAVLNLNLLNNDQCVALLELSDANTRLLARQACGDKFSLPYLINATQIDPDHLDAPAIELIHNIYPNNDAKQHGGLLPGKDYLSITKDTSSQKAGYIARVVNVTQFIPIDFIQPANLSDASKIIIFNLLTTLKDINLFYSDKLYPMTTPENKIRYVSLSNNVARYKSTKSNEDRYAVSGQELGSGYQGVVYKSERTLVCQQGTVSIKIKTADKHRVIKIGSNMEKLQVTRHIARHYAAHEYLMMSALPNIFHAKRQIDDPKYNMSANISRYFSGKELYDVLYGNNAVSFDIHQQLVLCTKLAEKLQILHAGGIIHRDLKPENIVVTLDPHTNNVIDVHLIDLGLSISTQEAAIGGGAIPGSPQYASPEAWEKKALMPTSDTFSLGRIFWQILSGKHISDFIQTRGDATNALMPDAALLFGQCGADETHPLYIQSLYYLLTRMNEKNPTARITLNAILKSLAQIQALANAHTIGLSPNNGAQTAAAAASSAGLFGTTQASAAARAGSDPYYTAMIPM